MAVADDGSTTFVLYGAFHRGATPEYTIGMRTISRAGAQTDALVDDGYGAFFGPTRGSLVARAGRWWAAWGTFDDGGAVHVYSARTMGTPQSSHDTGVAGRTPQIVLGATAAVMVVQWGSWAQDPIAISRAPIASGTWSAPSRIPGKEGFRPNIQLDGNVTRVAYYNTDFRTNQLIVAQSINGTWSSQTIAGPPSRPTLSSPLFVGSGTETVIGDAVASYTSTGTLDTLRTRLLQLGADGSWRSRELRTGMVSELASLNLVGKTLVAFVYVHVLAPTSPVQGQFIRSQ